MATLGSAKALGIFFGIGVILLFDRGLLLGFEVSRLNWLLGSTGVILSRNFRRNQAQQNLVSEVNDLKSYWNNSSGDTQPQVEADLLSIQRQIQVLESSMQ